MSADFYQGCFVGAMSTLTILGIMVVSSRRMTKEHKSAHESTLALLADANVRRSDIACQISRVANELEQRSSK